jgi:hypothetical protein
LWPLVAIGAAMLVGAGVLGAVGETAQMYAGVTAVVLCVVPACATVWGTGRLAEKTRYAGLISMAVGTAVRTFAVIVGGVAVYKIVPVFRDAKYEFWCWVLGAYLVVLIAETAILARFFLASTKGNAA